MATAFDPQGPLTSPERTAGTIQRGLHKAIEAVSDASPLASVTTKQVAEIAALTFYILGEVYEKQFFPSDREQCQRVARELLKSAGIEMPNVTMMPV